VDARKKARQVATQAQLRSVAQAVEMFQASAGKYPTTEEGLGALVKTSPAGVGPLLPGGTVPLDAWKNPLRYERLSARGAAYRVWSAGPDGQDGTADDASHTGGR
jgi:general secretion pathway protein G